MKVQEALDDLVECARLLGQTQGKKVYGDYTQEDSRFTVAMYQSIEKHSSIIKSALSEIEKCEPVLKVYQGEICYKSQADEQSYGMWCPVNFDTAHTFKEGTEFYTSPISKEWVDLSDQQIQNLIINSDNYNKFQFIKYVEHTVKQLNAEKG